MNAPRSEVGPAEFSRDRVYRYSLTRVWDSDRPNVCFIGLNPSTADERALDPTLRRCLGFAHAWGFGSFTMVNLFAFRATDPMHMKMQKEPVGEVVHGHQQNNVHILHHGRSAEKVIACWGAHGKHLGRGTEVRRLLQAVTVPMYAFKFTKHGEPMHPLYISSETQPIAWPYS
jgi:hypothetical protein